MVAVKAIIIVVAVIMATTVGGTIIFLNMLQNAGCDPSLSIHYSYDYEINETIVNHGIPLVNMSNDNLDNVPLVKDGIIQLANSNKSYINIESSRDQLSTISDFINNLSPKNSFRALFWYDGDFYTVGFFYC